MKYTKNFSRKLSAAALAAPMALGGAIKVLLFIILVLILIRAKKVNRPQECFLIALLVAFFVCAAQLVLDRTDLYNSLRFLTPIIIPLVVTIVINKHGVNQLNLSMINIFIVLSTVDIITSFVIGLAHHGVPTSVAMRHAYKVNTVIFPDTNYAGFFLGVCLLYCFGRPMFWYKCFALIGVFFAMSVSVWLSLIGGVFLYSLGRFGGLLLYPAMIGLTFASLILELISGSIGDVSKQVILETSLKLIAFYPVLGVGIGAFDEYNTWSAHTIISQVAEVGALGMLVMFLMIAPLLYRALTDKRLNAIAFFCLSSGVLSFFPMSFVGLVALLGLTRR